MSSIIDYLEFENEIIFTGSGLPTSKALGESLLGLDYLGNHLTRTISKLQPVIFSPTAHIYIREIAPGSIKEKILTKLFFNSEKELEEFIEKIRDTKVKDLITSPYFISFLLGGLALYGLQGCLNRSEATADQVLQVQGNYNNVIQIGSDVLELKKEDLSSIIENSTPKSKHRQLTREAHRFILPARDNEGQGIFFGEESDILIEPETIQSIPRELKDEPREFEEVHENQEIQFRAIDLDKKTGWAAVAPGITESRVKVEIASHLNRERLYQEGSVEGTVVATFKQIAEDKTKCVRLYLQSVD